MFQLHKQLQQDCALLGDFPLCRVLLLKDALYPWLVLVPKREDVTEIYQLSSDDQQQLMKESSFVAQRMMTLFNADKMNIAAIGNMVPQLHIHHVARFQVDAAWPKPVWGAVPAQPYEDSEFHQRIHQLQSVFREGDFPLTV